MSKQSTLLRRNLLLVKMVVKIVVMTTKDFEYHGYFVDKVVTVYERMDSSFESSSVGNAI